MNKNIEVDTYLEKKAHPLTAEINTVREIILRVSDEITETIKWSSPTFIYKGNMASFFMNAKKHVSLMFHEGAIISDKNGLLEGDGKEGRVAKFDNMEDIETKKSHLEEDVREWMRLQDEVYS